MKAIRYTKNEINFVTIALWVGLSSVNYKQQLNETGKFVTNNLNDEINVRCK